MWKIVLMAIFLIGAAFAYPPTRAKIMTFLGPGIEKLGPVGVKIAKPAKRWSAKNEAEVLVNKIAQNHMEGRGATPTPGNFKAWLQANAKGERRGKDPWDQWYYLVRKNREFIVGSAGPDLKKDTEDDIRVSATI